MIGQGILGKGEDRSRVYETNNECRRSRMVKSIRSEIRARVFGRDAVLDDPE